MTELPEWKYLMIHHSWSLDHDTLDWAGIRKYHMSFRIDGHIVTGADYYKRKREGDGTRFQTPWSDIGYHYGIEKVNNNYEVLIGRPVTKNGAHCLEKKMNMRSIGICFVGNYDNIAPEDNMLSVAVKRLIVPLMLTYKIPLKNVKLHREYATYKSCPGNKFTTELLNNLIILYANGAI
jgi:N-acetyl-anhydromuramyl-L-alanine amidase AmpD